MTELLNPNEWFRDVFGQVPRAMDLVSRWLGMIDSPRYAAHVKILREFGKGFDPMPKGDHIEPLLRAAGHDFAVVDSLAKGNVLRLLFRGGYIYRESYAAVHGTVAALLLPRRTKLTDDDLLRLYSTIDRLLRGGEDWPSVTRVQAVNRAYFKALSQVKIPFEAAIVAPLKGIIKTPGLSKFGQCFDDIQHMAGGTVELLIAANAHRHGRKKATPEDAVEAGFAFARLFDVDLRELPLVERVGTTGYELAR